jgi:hypothetical protein
LIRSPPRCTIPSVFFFWRFRSDPVEANETRSECNGSHWLPRSSSESADHGKLYSDPAAGTANLPGGGHYWRSTAHSGVAFDTRHHTPFPPRNSMAAIKRGLQSILQKRPDDVVIVTALRTPIAKFKGSFKVSCHVHGPPQPTYTELALCRCSRTWTIPS